MATTVTTRWINPAKRCDMVITITTTRRRWWLFGPTVERVRQYRGSGTVWYPHPAGKRCNTALSVYLADVWRQARWENNDE